MLQRLKLWFDNNVIIHESIDENGRYILYTDHLATLEEADCHHENPSGGCHVMKDKMIQSYFAYIFGKTQEVVLKSDHRAALKEAVKEKDQKFAILHEQMEIAVDQRDEAMEQIAVLKAERDKAVLSTHRTAIMMNDIGAILGSDTSVTIDGLPIAMTALKDELARWKAVAPDRSNLEYIISLEADNKRQAEEKWLEEQRFRMIENAEAETL